MATAMRGTTIASGGVSCCDFDPAGVAVKKDSGTQAVLDGLARQVGSSPTGVQGRRAYSDEQLPV